MSKEVSDGLVPFVSMDKVKEVEGLSGYQKPSFSHLTYGINKVTTRYIPVTEDMLSGGNTRVLDN